MATISIRRSGKQKYIDVSPKTHEMLAILKVFHPPHTPVKLGGYMFQIREIEPWPPELYYPNMKLDLQ